jgi:cytochrome c-type biogenesis protein
MKLTMGEIVVSGFLPLAILVAVLAGVVSFLSPCVLPLIPGYLSVLGSSNIVSKPVLPTIIFVLSFTTVFASYGIAFGQIGSYLIEYQDQINIIFGLLLIVMGLIFAGLGRFAQMQFKLPIKGVLKSQPILLGIVFAVGWTPCIGPTLAAVQTLALTEGTATKGAVLSISYGLGLGIPFILISVLANKSIKVVQKLRAKQQVFIRIGSGFLILLGILLITGLWTELVVWMQQRYAGFTVPL